MNHRTSSKPEPKRPAIPAEWYRPTAIGFATYFAVCAGWVPAFGWLSMQIADSGLPFWAKALALVPTMLLAGHGFHLLGFFGHDGVHLALVNNKYWSMALGCFMGAATLHPVLGYGVTHYNHHRFTNQESDPDTKLYPRHTTFWRRFFLGRVTASRGYMRNTLRIVAGRPLDQAYRIPFNATWTRFFAVLTLLSFAFWIGVYASIALAYPTHFVVMVLIPLVSAIPATGLRIYLEHNGTGPGIFSNTRSYISPLWTVLMFGNNYHLEHHLYPSVPAYRLPRLHRLLRDRGFYEGTDANIERSFFGPLRFLSGKYQYPEALRTDHPEDPFDVRAVAT